MNFTRELLVSLWNQLKADIGSLMMMASKYEDKMKDYLSTIQIYEELIKFGYPID